MDWFFGNDPTSVADARSRLLTTQAMTAVTFIVGLLSLFAFLEYAAGTAASAALVLAVACLVVCPMAYAHGLELRRHLIAMGGSPTLSTDDFGVQANEVAPAAIEDVADDVVVDIVDKDEITTDEVVR